MFPAWGFQFKTSWPPFAAMTPDQFEAFVRKMIAFQLPKDA